MKITDKILHFVVMLVVSATLFLAINPWWAFAICVAASAGKEVYDCFKKNPTGFDLYDLAADMAGVMCGYLLTLWIR